VLTYSVGFSDPDGQVGYAYVTNKMGFLQGKDTRDLALRNAFYSAADNACLV